MTKGFLNYLYRVLCETTLDITTNIIQNRYDTG